MSDFLDPRIAREVLRRRLNGDEPITEADVKEARHLASANPSLDNQALYARIKREHANPSERTLMPEVVRVTPGDVEEARVAAQRNPSPTMMARWISAKREYTAQMEVGAAE